MDSDGVNQIVTALGLIHNPRSSNDDRRQAQQFLDKVRLEPESPFWGYQLSLPNSNNNTIVRHFGLTLLEKSIMYDYDTYNLEKILTVRKWIIELCSNVTNDDPNYIKEKLAFLWVALAKRSWGIYVELDCAPLDLAALNEILINKDKSAPNHLPSGWVDMDKDLFQLWNANLFTRELSLIIFRTLFEDIFILEDPIAISRSPPLNLFCSEIMSSSAIVETYYDASPLISIARASDHGWLKIWSDFLQQCLSNQNDKNSLNFINKILSTFKACLHWIFPANLLESDILQRITSSLLSNDIHIKILAVDCLHALLTRTFLTTEEFNKIVGAIFMPEGIQMLSQVYDSVILDPNNINEHHYSFIKKLVEMCVGLSSYLNIMGYLKLILKTTCNESLIVSGLSLNFWVSMLRIDTLSNENTLFFQLLPDLLEICANRLLNYSDLFEQQDNNESYTDDFIQSSNNNNPHFKTLPSKKYIDIDFDSTPEINTFLSNYIKYLDDIIRIIVCKRPKEGLRWLEQRLKDFFFSDHGLKCLNQSKLYLNKKIDLPYFWGYQQFEIIESTVKGISRWKIWYDDDKPDKQSKLTELNQLVEILCENLLALNLCDLMLLRKQIQTLVQFTPLLKDTQSGLMLKVLEKILTISTFEINENASDEERELVRDLRITCGTELNRLGYMIPESLKEILNDLENVIANILLTKKISAHESVAFKSFLLVVSQRSSLAKEIKFEKFSKIVDPELEAWNDPATMKGLSELPWFMERLGIVKIAEYFKERGINGKADLLTIDMDDKGRKLKSALNEHWGKIFPVRATRIYVQYSIEKLPHTSPDYLHLLSLWKPRIQPILPYILQLISQIQKYHNPQNWLDLPIEVQSFVKDSCAERFWQVGVSTKSRDSFVSESVKAMHTLRDFADSVGHIVRYTREYAFLAIASISQLEDTLYEIPGMGELLWKAAASDSAGISLHSWRHMINLLFRNTVKNCPAKFVVPFMGPLLTIALPAIDELLTKNWEMVYNNGIQLQGNENDDALSEEMMQEHLLRQLTAVVDRMLIDLVGQLNSRFPLNETQIEIRTLIFNNKELLGSFLQLLTHVISFKDTKCSYNAILILRNCYKEILLKDEEVDKWLCKEIFVILATILNDTFFQDVHAEAGYLFTEIYIYLRSKYDFPAYALEEILQCDDKVIKNMESLMGSSKSLRQRKVCLIQTIIANNEAIQKQDRKRLLAGRNRKKLNTDLMNGDEHHILGNLFG
ncbi:karyopherin MSN5 [Ascoidea rubescens DSM 1968]|uniref:Karyopherin n=1 Tax=Ascoidea rubescens DSM 1968 TaxID=1344418 RepID=A0A1D2VRH5_9ASCO|nr:Karyopherin [Ascoidea rubescens DSM 1968]ODV64211.1 Karyopherin [Ascoidea rubescens DSM 1968]